MKQDGLSLQFTVLDSDEKQIRRYDTEKVYFWYKSQKVLSTQGGSAGLLLHGLYESFYDNKQLCEKGSYTKGLKDGEWNYWRTDGTLSKIEHWKSGRAIGEQIYFSEIGTVQKRILIRRHEITTEAGDTLIVLSGRSRSVTLMDSIGRPASIARYKNNVLHGKQEIIAPDGTKTHETYKNGTLVVPKEKKAKTDAEKTDTEKEAATKKKPFQRLKGVFSRKNKEEKTTDTKSDKPKAERKRKSKEKDQEPKTEEESPKKHKLFKRKSA